MALRKLVSIVDDDESVRESFPDLLQSFGIEAEPFASAEAFLESDGPTRTACLILDLAMPGMSGPELQQELLRRNIEIPIIFITGDAFDQVRASTLMRGGAVACLSKPFSDDVLLAAINAALGTKVIADDLTPPNGVAPG